MTNVTRNSLPALMQGTGTGEQQQQQQQQQNPKQTKEELKSKRMSILLRVLVAGFLVTLNVTKNARSLKAMSRMIGDKNTVISIKENQIGEGVNSSTASSSLEGISRVLHAAMLANEDENKTNHKKKNSTSFTNGSIVHPVDDMQVLPTRTSSKKKHEHQDKYEEYQDSSTLISPSQGSSAFKSSSEEAVDDAITKTVSNPTKAPTNAPTNEPTPADSTPEPTNVPVSTPALVPTASPTNTPSSNPTNLAGASNGDNDDRDDVEMDWIQEKAFLNRKCFSFEHVCHEQNGIFWYHNDKRNSNNNIVIDINIRRKGISNTHLEFLHDDAGNNHSASALFQRSQNCSYSPVPHHLVVNGMFNDMLGEFYIRTLPGLDQIYQNLTHPHQFFNKTQLYLHLYRGQLMESHHMFTQPYRCPTGNSSSCRPLLDFREAIQKAPSSSCQCFRRFTWCGATQMTAEEIAKKQNMTNNEKQSPQTPSKTITNITYLQYRGDDFSDIRVEPTSPVRRRLQQYAANHPQLKQARQHILTNSNISTGEKEKDDKWKIIGLADRIGRRRWVNVDAVWKACNARLNPHKVICIIVKVEFMTPLEHALVHANLDALIGIHGAQLTEAVWMPPGSLAVELLPFIPVTVKDGKIKSWGGWTRETRGHTPLGTCFDETDLFHIGLPLLSNETSPPCLYNETEEAAQECFITGGGWANHDFLAPVEILLSGLEHFFLHRPTECQNFQEEEEQREKEQKQLSSLNSDEVKAAAERRHWALYNIPCQQNGKPTIRHFYWKDSLETMDQYSKFFPPMLSSKGQNESSKSALTPQGEQIIAAQKETIRVRDSRIEELEKKLAALSVENKQ